MLPKYKGKFQTNLEILAERIRETLGAGESAEDDVSELHTARGNDVTEGEVIITEELWEVVEQHQQTPQRSFVQCLLFEDQFRVSQERVEELEEINEKLLVKRPALSRLGFVLRGQHFV